MLDEGLFPWDAVQLRFRYFLNVRGNCLPRFPLDSASDGLATFFPFQDSTCFVDPDMSPPLTFSPPRSMLLIAEPFSSFHSPPFRVPSLS